MLKKLNGENNSSTRRIKIKYRITKLSLIKTEKLYSMIINFNPKKEDIYVYPSSYCKLIKNFRMIVVVSFQINFVYGQVKIVF